MKRKTNTKKHSPARVTKNVWFMMRFAFRHTPSYIFVELGEGIGRGLYHIFGILYTKYLFDAIESGIDFVEVLTVSLIFAAYNAMFELFNKWRLCVYRPRASLILHEKMQSELYRKARELDQCCYDDPAFYNDFIWAISESDKRVDAIMDNIALFINRVLSSVVILGVLFTMDWIVAIVLLVSVALGLIVKFMANKVRYARSLELNPINRKLAYIGRIFYLPDHAKELRQGQIAERMREQYDEATEEKIACFEKFSGKLFVLSLLSSLFTNALPHAGVTGYLIARYLTDPTLSLGSFSASINATFKLYWTLDDIGNYVTKFNEHSLYVEKFRRFLEYEPQIKGEITDVPAFESLTVKNLCFAYPFSKESSRSVLNHIDLEIKKGEKIALVGYNGAGKTTLIKLLMRLYDPVEGEILYNGKSICHYDPESYRQHIGALFQDYKVFAATLAENVMGAEYTDADEATVLHALGAASFDDKLATLPNGIHSQLTREFCKDGVGLSGGEAQKVAIARVFARPYELIVMDEPSSALDPIAEYNLNRSIAENAKDRTVIFISHRLSTTRMADRIYMLDQGAVIECGSHEELMKQNGKYAEMYRVQAQKYQTK